MTRRSSGTSAALQTSSIAFDDVTISRDCVLEDHGAQALHVDGDLTKSRKCFDAAYQTAELQRDGNAMALASLGLAGLWVHEHRSMASSALVELRLRRSLEAAPPMSLLALRLRARIVGEADYRAGRNDAILAVVEEARTSGDPIALAESLSLAQHCLLGPDHAAARRQVSQELSTISLWTGRRGDYLMAKLWHTVNLFLAAESQAPEQLAAMRRLLAVKNHQAIGFVVQAIDVMLDIRAGRFEQAEKRASVCAHSGTAAGDVDATGWYGAHLVALRWYQGRITELLPMLRELVTSSTLSDVDNSMFAALAVAAAHAGDHRQAAGALARLGGPDLARLPRSSSWLASIYGAVEAAHVLQDSRTSAAAHRLLSPFAHLPMVGSLAVTCFGSVQLALGTASLTVGEPAAAVEHLREAVRANVMLGHRPAAALARMRLSRALTLRSEPGDAVAAQQERDRAQREASELQMILPGMQAQGQRVTSWPKPHRLVVCKRRGQHWSIESGNRHVLVNHSIGMTYLAALLSNPGQEIAAAELSAGPRLRRLAATGSRQPVLDDAARQAYRKRIAVLQEQIAQYEQNGSPAQVQQAHAEREWLFGELAAATGLGGRPRTFATSDERARIAVGKAIRRALDRITTLDPVLGQELRATIHTGQRCQYRPT